MNGYRSTIYPNAFMISEEVAKAIMGEDFKSAKEGLMNTSANDAVYKANVKMQFEKHTNVLQSSNIVGLIEGTDLKDEYVVLTAHYDHVGKRGDSVIYYGADDDGSGTVSLIEFAEAFQKAKKDGKGPRRSIVIMAVSGEEKGLWGSGYYGDNPLFPLEKTTVNLNTDMIGRIDPKRKVGDSTNYVYVVGDDKLSTDPSWNWIINSMIPTILNVFIIAVIIIISPAVVFRSFFILTERMPIITAQLIHRIKLIMT